MKSKFGRVVFFLICSALFSQCYNSITGSQLESILATLPSEIHGCASRYRNSIKSESGLVGYWSFEEIEGGMGIDETGGGTNFTYNSGITQGVTGFDGVGKAISLANGSNGGSDATTTQVVSTAVTNVSIETWFNWAGDTSGSNVFFFNGNTSLNGWGPYIRTDSVLTIHMGAAGGYTTSYTVVSNQWIHLAAVFGTSGPWIVYINGQQLPPGTDPFDNEGGFVTPAGSMLLSNNGGAMTEFFGGMLDDTAIYQKALSTQEIQNHYHVCRRD